jgi:hypothetical protein
MVGWDVRAFFAILTFQIIDHASGEVVIDKPEADGHTI